jgi:hypothetical protein
LMEMLKCLGNLEESGRIWETYGDDWEKRWEKLILNEKNQAMGMSKGVKYLWFSWKGSGGWSMSVLAHQHDGNTFTILYLYSVVHHHFSGETMQLFILFFQVILDLATHRYRTTVGMITTVTWCNWDIVVGIFFGWWVPTGEG